MNSTTDRRVLYRNRKSSVKTKEEQLYDKLKESNTEILAFSYVHKLHFCVLETDFSSISSMHTETVTGYVLERRFTKFCEITQIKGHL